MTIATFNKLPDMMLQDISDMLNYKDAHNLRMTYTGTSKIIFQYSVQDTGTLEVLIENIEKYTREA
jgi:hypothetical protein